MKNRIKIEFRKKQFFLNQDPLQPVIVSCNPDGTATYTPGITDQTWYDMTEWTEGLDQLKISWTAVTENFGEGDGASSNEFGSNYSKGLTIDLKFFKDAFQFVYDWLMTDACQILNAIEVRITDQDCENNYRLFEIKVDNIRYKPVEEPCILNIPLRENDPVIHSFEKTIIEDNWQGWFNRDGTSTKDHPTFSFIVEKKPKFFLAIYVALIYVIGIISVGILIGISDGKKWIRRTLGFTYFCPSPLIRTYIENICQKFGYTFETIFDDDPANPYRDLCLFFPASATFKEFGETFNAPVGATKFIWENRTVLPFSKFLDELKKVFNAEWYVTPNKKLVFKHKSFFDNQPPIYDFTAAGSDKLYNLEYSFNGKKKPAYGNYQYLVDPQDTASNELRVRYNAIVDYDGPANNPMLEGNITKSFDFAMTSFHKDGSSEDFLQESIEAGRLVALGAVLVGFGDIFLASNFLTAAVVAALLLTGYLVTNNYMNDFFTDGDMPGMIRIGNSNVVNQPRLILWDRASPIYQAKTVSVEDPAQNPYYNTSGNDYYQEHPAHDAPAGYFGTAIRKIYNYPMYVEELFTDNLYDRFHEYDNPLKNPFLNQNWEGEVDLCCEWLDRLGAWEADYAKIGATLVLENRNGRLITGRLTGFEINYDGGNITLKGTVLR